MRWHTVLEFLALGVLEGHNVACGWGDWVGGTLQGHIDEVADAKWTAADRAVDLTEVIVLNHHLH